jgi:hypothetical protein
MIISVRLLKKIEKKRLIGIIISIYSKIKKEMLNLSRLEEKKFWKQIIMEFLL